MKKGFIFALSFLVLSLAFFVPAVFAEEFSADIISSAKGQTFQGRIYVGKDKIKMESPQATSITRLDKGVIWILMPPERQYIEQPFDTSTFIMDSEKVDGELSRKLIGQDNIDGRTANKYEVEYSRNGKRSTLWQWLVPGLNVPVKSSATDGSWIIEYKNIALGTQPDSLFEVPPQYQKMSFGNNLTPEQIKGMADDIFR